MQYQKPSLSQFRPFFASETQTGQPQGPSIEFLTANDCACPDVLLFPVLPNAQDVDVMITMTFQVGSCNATVRTINPQDFLENDILDGGRLHLGCSADNFTCDDNGTCTLAQKGQTGTGCVTEVIINGQTQPGFPVCAELAVEFADDAVQACIDLPEP